MQASPERIRSDTDSLMRKKFSQAMIKVNRNTSTISVAHAQLPTVPNPNRIAGRNRNIKGSTNPAIANRSDIQQVFIKSAFAMPLATRQPMATGGVRALISP